MMALKSDADCNVLERQVKHELGVRSTEGTQQKRNDRSMELKSKETYVLVCIFFLPLPHKWLLWCGKVLFIFPVSCWQHFENHQQLWWLPFDPSSALRCSLPLFTFKSLISELQYTSHRSLAASAAVAQNPEVEFLSVIVLNKTTCARNTVNVWVVSRLELSHN